MNVSRAMSVVTAMGLAGLLGMAAAPGAARQSVSQEPWTPGYCYRVTIIYPEQQHTLRVLEAPRGAWVRVVSDPASPRVPGAPPRSPVWLNTASVFTLQAVECSREAYE